MMVEAGGTEKPRGTSTKTAPRRSPKRSSPRVSKRRSSGSARRSSSRRSSSPRSCVRTARSTPIPYERPRRLRRPTCSPRSPSTASRDTCRGDGHRRQDRAQRPPRRDRRGPAARARRHAPTSPVSSPARAGEVKQAFRSLQKQVVRSPHRQRGRAHRRPWHRRPPAALRRGRHHPHVARHGPVPAGRDPGAVRSLTLGMPRMEQLHRHSIELRRTAKRYMHHYNFPPFSTGETGRVGSPKRREIGHGALAERALLPVVPIEGRVALHAARRLRRARSNGSTSMASVCGSTLSLMDAGVPIKAPVAGIAMGLVYADGKYTTLTDILGTEDAFGDMDFKVAGTPRVRHRAAARHEDRRPPGRRARAGAAARPTTPG